MSAATKVRPRGGKDGLSAAEEMELRARKAAEAQAKDDALATAIAEVNRRYAFVHAVGTRTAVLDTEADDVSRSLLAKDTLFERLANRPVQVIAGYDKHGFAIYKTKTLGSVWFHHPDRREYSRVAYMPGKRRVGQVYNTWRGWGVQLSFRQSLTPPLRRGPRGRSLFRPMKRKRKPVAGDFKLFRDHILNNICSGNREQAAYVMDWIADIFQNPMRKPGVALALQGGQGVGKTVLGEVIGHLIGASGYVATANANLVLGDFNAMCESKLLIQMEEAVWAGDAKSQNRLKDTITTETLTIRQLYTAPYTAPFHARFLFTSNEDWFVPVESGDRRFAVFYVSDRRKEDKEYFGRLFAELKANGGAGYKALLRHLLSREIPEDRFRRIIETDARTAQLVRTFKRDQDWWYNILQEGTLPGRSRDGWVNGWDVYNSFLRHVKNVKHSRADSPNTIRDFLFKHVPGLEKTKKSVPTGPDSVTERVPCYSFPSLAECREAFGKIVGVSNLPWEPAEDWDEANAAEYERMS